MAENPANVKQFLKKIWKFAKIKAKSELEELMDKEGYDEYIGGLD